MEEVSRLFVHHQVHFIYAERFSKARGPSPYLCYLESVTKVQEIAWLQKFRGIIAFSENDRQALLPYLPDHKLFHQPLPRAC